MILRNHGLLALGTTVREAFEIMYYLDCACQIQQGLAGAAAHARAQGHQIRCVTGRRPGSCSTVKMASAVKPQMP
jgi:ribulose-5-phosphate 4-epimerase/fuculose-1-phosphate aldolase